MLEVAGAHWGALAPRPELALGMFPTAAGACCSRGLRVGGADARVVAEVSRVVFDAGAGGRGAPRPLWAVHHLTCWQRGMQDTGEKRAKREIDAERMWTGGKRRGFAELGCISRTAIGAFLGLTTNHNLWLDLDPKPQFGGTGRYKVMLRSERRDSYILFPNIQIR